MLRQYLSQEDCERLTVSVRNHKSLAPKILWCFHGPASSGKTTVATHIVALTNDIVSVEHIPHDVSSLPYIIVTIITNEQLEEVKQFCQKKYYVLQYFRFEKVFNHS